MIIDGPPEAILEIASGLFQHHLQLVTARLAENSAGMHEIVQIEDPEDDCLFLAIAVDSTWPDPLVRNIVSDFYISRLSTNKLLLVFPSLGQLEFMMSEICET
jgi:hypothetical protein